VGAADFFSAIRGVADFPENRKIGRVKTGAAVVGKSVSLVVFGVAEALAGVAGALAPALRVVAARIAAWAMIIDRGMGAARALATPVAEVGSVAGGVFPVASGVIVGAAAFFTFWNTGSALMARVARLAAGGTPAGFAARIAEVRGGMIEVGVAGVDAGETDVARNDKVDNVVVGSDEADGGAVGVATAGASAGGVATAAVVRLAHGGVGRINAGEASSCCIKSANVAEGSFGAGAAMIADALVPGAVAGRKPSDVLPEYAFMI
jgi:hypothetical protein